MRHLPPAIAALLIWSSFSGGLEAAAGDEPSDYRAIVIVETSKDMVRRQEIVLRTLHALLDKQFKTFLRPGEQLDFWTFGKRLNINAIPPQKWDPDEVRTITSQMAEAVVSATPDKKPDLGQVMAALPGISRGAKDNIVFLLLTGEQMIRGTPLDESVNQVFIAHAPGMEEARKPFVLVLVSRDGRWVGESVSPGGHAIHIPVVALRPDEPEEVPETPLASEPETLSVPKPTTVPATTGTVAVEPAANQSVVIVEPEDPVEIPAEPAPVEPAKALSVEEITAMIAAQQRANEESKLVSSKEETTPKEMGKIVEATPPVMAEAMAMTVEAADPGPGVGAPDPQAGLVSEPTEVVAVKEQSTPPEQRSMAAAIDSTATGLVPGPASGESERAPEPVVEAEPKVEVASGPDRLEGDIVFSELQTASAVESSDEDQEMSGVAAGSLPPPSERSLFDGRQSRRGWVLPSGWLNLSLGVVLLVGAALLLGWTLRRRSTQRFEPSFISRSFDRNR